MEDYAIKFEHVSKIYKLKKKNDCKSKSSYQDRDEETSAVPL